MFFVGTTKNLQFRLQILRLVYPERLLQTLRFAQSDKPRRARDDILAAARARSSAPLTPCGAMGPNSLL
jgi:hypothetical protein